MGTADRSMSLASKKKASSKLAKVVANSSTETPVVVSPTKDAKPTAPTKDSKPSLATPHDVALRNLERELLEHNEFFDMLVDMIPSKLYISGQSGDDFNPKYFKKSVSETSKQARKLVAKTAKRRKLNPDAVETTVQTKARLEKTTSSAVVVPEDGTMESSQPKSVQVLAPGQSRIEALRAKLQAKIAAKRGTMTTNNNTAAAAAASNSEAVSKRAARRLEKNRRKLEAQRRKATTTSTAEQQQQHAAKSYTVTPNTTTATDASSTMLQDLQHLDFGRLTGLDSRTTAGGTVDTKNYATVNKSLQNLSKGKNLHKLLADAEAKRLKLQQLKASTDAADQAKVTQLQWTDTFKEADGTRVKDDPKRLKKAIARKDATKRKSSKAWQSRMEQTQSAAQQRQQIRQHNLQARKQGGSVGANLSSQKIKDTAPSTAAGSGGGAEPKGRRLSRAGFEGRKPDFLNSAKKEHAPRSNSNSSHHGKSGGAKK
jgi:Surfeit locus protein 6/60S ribosome biogenesis protein Rrp14